MIFYIIIFAFCTIMFMINNLISHKEQKKYVEIITLITLCIVSGTRYYLGGTDYYIYIKIFDAVPIISKFDLSNVQSIYGTFGVEKGYLLFNSIIKSIGFNFFGLTLIHSIIFYSCIYIGLKRYSKNFNFLLVIFMYKMFFYNTFISMRQSIAIIIFFIAIKYLEERKAVKYFSCCLLALFFHNSAIILFPIYFLNSFKLTKKKLIILNIVFIPTILLGLLQMPVLQPFNFIIKLFDSPVAIEKADKLVNQISTSSISIIHTFEYFLLMFFVVLNFDKINKTNKNSEIILWLFVVLLPIFTLFRGYEIFTREKDYFILTYAIILEYLCLISSSKQAFFIKFITIIICLYSFIRFIILFDNGALMPYKSFLFNGISIFQ